MAENIQHPRNQLDRVICQVRFPALLEINRRIDEYQGCIRPQYADYSESIPIPMNLANAPAPVDHTFRSDDGNWFVTLSVNSMSLTSTGYTSWGDFRARFDYAFSPVVEIFGIEEFQRIGLRYINAVKPSSIGIADMKDLLKPPYSELLDTNLGSARGMSSVFDYGLPGGISGRSTIGMIRFIDGETGILIDDDAFIEEHIRREDVVPRMDRLNEASLSAFKKIASDELLSKVVQ